MWAYVNVVHLRKLGVQHCSSSIATQEKKAGIIERMKCKIDSPQGRYIYSQRLGKVEPVLGHITDAVDIKRFSLRGKRKVDEQWKLMMTLHNM
jgi:hypothetical protein